MLEYEVRAWKSSLAKFTVTAATKKEAETIIAEKLRDKELVWEDVLDDRVSVVCLSDNGNSVWRPRRYFYLVEYEDDFK